jgi:predicted AlkP superfamily pyrophosphatase or phosphodiesterase
MKTKLKLCFGLLFLASLLIFSFSCTQKNHDDRNKLLLISIDGFRADYTEIYDTPNLDKFAASGVVADYMIPVFPTKTFPNHYSIATGLYVENSGIISNNMYDPEMDQFYSLGNRESVQNPSWYGGEPIWVTAENQGIPTAPLFWPGSEAPIGGAYPTHWAPYDDELPYSARVDSVITWLQDEDETAPGFMTLYFSKVDTYGHHYGPVSDSVALALKEVDQYIGYLLSELDRIKYRDNLNIIIVSDHGMTEVSEDKVILLDKLFNLADAEIIDWAPVTTIKPNEGKSKEIYSKLKESESHYTVYMKDEIPDDFRFKKNLRVPEIVLVAESGYSVTSTERMLNTDINGGDHGYRPSDPDMRAVFFASGPDFKAGKKIPSFQSIHLYELMASLLNIDPAPNDGHIDSLKYTLN